MTTKLEFAQNVDLVHRIIRQLRADGVNPVTSKKIRQARRDKLGERDVDVAVQRLRRSGRIKHVRKAAKIEGGKVTRWHKIYGWLETAAGKRVKLTA